jgi:hypothetical protein
MINEALAQGIPVPRSGFVIRSAAIKAAPDLKVCVTMYTLQGDAWVEDKISDPLLRHTRLDDFSLLCVLECGLDQIYKISFTQPPHQQRFAFPVNVDFDLDTGAPKRIEPELHVRALYTNDKAPGAQGSWNDLDQAYQFSENEQKDFYDTDKRLIAPDLISSKLGEKLVAWNAANGGQNGPYTDAVVDSCVLGFELNDPSCKQAKTLRKMTSAN